jgi:hypothetical protein
MTFLAPVFLAALAALAIPVIIHLLNFRRPKRVAFSTLAFFRELKQSTIRRLKIKRFLLLMLRVLAVVALVLALSRPYTRPASGLLTSGVPVLYGLVLENGIGMARVDAHGPYIEQARELANGIVEMAREQDRFLIVNTHGELVRPGVLNKSQALQAINAVEAGSFGSRISPRFDAAITAIDDWAGGASVVYWFTAAGETVNQAFTTMVSENESVPLHVIRIGGARLSNTVVTGIDAAGSVAGPGRPFNLEVSVANLGQEPAVNHFVSMEVEGQLTGQYQADIQPGETRTFLFEVIPAHAGDLTGRILLEGDAFTPDNTRYFSISVPDRRQVLLVGEDQSARDVSYLRSVLRAGEQTRSQIGLTTTGINQLAEISDLNQYDAIVLDGLANIPDGIQEILQRFVQSGRGLVFYPSERGSIVSYNRFLSRFNAGEVAGFSGEFGSFNPVTNLGRISEGHPVLDQIFDKPESEEIRVDLPSVYYYLRYRSGGDAAAIPILRTALGDPLLLEQRFGNGRLLIYMIGAGPGWSALPGNALFAPLAYRTALMAAGAEVSVRSEHVLGPDLDIVLPFSSPIADIRHEEALYRAEVRPTGGGEVNIRFPAVSWVPGVYSISDGSDTRLLAVNLDVSESDFRTLSNRELENILKVRFNQVAVYDTGEGSPDAIRADISSAGFGSEVWHWFILLALIFLFAESAVSRWYKAETIT